MQKILKYMVAIATVASLAIVPVCADAEKVVTIGEDLSDKQERSMLKYFGVDSNKVRIIYVTNDEEVDFLSDYIPLSVIGTRTLSCAYVKPTNSGGIQVKTANLNWVTPNMIASALSTSGVKNCEVIAACPMEVSGTGALTGVLKAYEHASNTKLDSNKKTIAAQEIATTSNIAQTIGQNEATQIVNEIKVQLLEDKVDSTDYVRIEEIVDDAVDRIYDQNDEIIDLSEEEMDELRDLAEKIAGQKYEFNDMKETLSRIENNVSKDPINITIENNNTNNNTDNNTNNNADQTTNNNDNSNTTNNTNNSTNDNALDDDSILKNTNDDALGEDVLIEATTAEALDNAGSEELDESIFEDMDNENLASEEPSNGELFAIETEQQSTFNMDENTDDDTDMNTDSDDDTDFEDEFDYEFEHMDAYNSEENGLENDDEEKIKEENEEEIEEKDEEHDERNDTFSGDEITEDADEDDDWNIEEYSSESVSNYDGMDEIENENEGRTKEKELEIYLDDEVTISPFGISFMSNMPFEEGNMIVSNDGKETEVELSAENMLFYRSGGKYIGFIRNHQNLYGDGIRIEAEGHTFESDARTILPDVQIEQNYDLPYAYDVITDGEVSSDDDHITTTEEGGGYLVEFDGPGYGTITVNGETFDICAE